MGVSGKYVKTFAEANLAICEGMPLNADYPHPWFDVVGVDGKLVKLRDGHDEFSLAIKRGKHPQDVEYAISLQSSTFERMFGKKPTPFYVRPMKGERF